jgi:hypothetical protein
MSHQGEPTKLITATLKNGSASNLAVDGSSVEKVFTYSAPADYDVYLEQFQIIIETANALAFGNKFIDTTIATLTNGLLLETKNNDLEFNWQNMKRTRDLIEISESFEIVTGAVNFMVVRIKLPHELLLVKQGAFPADDYLRLKVRDNLTAITFAEAHFVGGRL